MMPQASHDEQARLAFVQDFKKPLALTVMPGNRPIYERRVEPAFRTRHGRAPSTRQEVRGEMQGTPYYQMFGSLQRTSQEMLWHGVSETVARQVRGLDARAGPAPREKHRATLALDSVLLPPRYMSAVDIHCMPGGYAGEAMGETAAGAIYNLGVLHYAMSSLGPNNDMAGGRMIAALESGFGELRPKHILDLGCTVGNSTLPSREAFPEAEIHAIDVSAPVLR